MSNQPTTRVIMPGCHKVTTYPINYGQQAKPAAVPATAKRVVMVQMSRGRRVLWSVRAMEFNQE